jgi:hypothetical protein
VDFDLGGDGRGGARQDYFLYRLGREWRGCFYDSTTRGALSITISQRYVHQGKVIAQSSIGRMEELQKKEPEREHKSKVKKGELEEVQTFTSLRASQKHSQHQPHLAPQE